MYLCGNCTELRSPVAQLGGVSYPPQRSKGARGGVFQYELPLPLPLEAMSEPPIAIHINS
jgi:hypothetical protein